MLVLLLHYYSAVRFPNWPLELLSPENYESRVSAPYGPWEEDILMDRENTWKNGKKQIRKKKEA